MQRILLFIVMGGLAFGAAVFGILAWQSVGEAQISVMGWLALGAGVVVTVLLGAGLMALVFFSARHGHDDNHYHSSPEPGEGD